MIAPHIDVIVADDKDNAREIVTRILQLAGVKNVRHAVDGSHAWVLIKAQRPDVLILDLEMPWDGATTLRHIRASLDPQIQQLPVVMMTADATRGNLEKMRDAGATEIVAKPLTPDALLARLEAALVQRRDYIATPHFTGPDRRRTARPAYEGPRRRAADLLDGDTLKLT